MFYKSVCFLFEVDLSLTMTRVISLKWGQYCETFVQSVGIIWTRHGQTVDCRQHWIL